MQKIKLAIVTFGAALLLVISDSAKAGDALVAVAANFVPTVEQLVVAFEGKEDHTVRLAIGSTGKLFAQITNGAPFDLFLSADMKHPILLEDRERIVPGSRFTYAIGKLVLLARPGRKFVESGPNMLSSSDVKRVAVANPDLAPYGQAALETVEDLGLSDTVQSKLIIAETVGQVHAFIQTSNVDVGFLALSQVIHGDPEAQGEIWIVPPAHYSTILQGAVLLSRAEDNPAAIAFYEFLKGDKAREIIESFGYDFPVGND